MSTTPSLYVRRKVGFGLGPGYFLHSLVPGILIMLISLLLVFSLTFIRSMTSSLSSLMITLGSGHLKVSGILEEREDEVHHVVQETSGLLFSESYNTALAVKIVDFPTYFDTGRREALRLEADIQEDVLNPVLLSRQVAGKLGLDPGDRFSMLVYEEDKDRTRPLLCTLSGIFDSGYDELDLSLCYLSAENVSSPLYTEVLLKNEADLETRRVELEEEGHVVLSYRELYSTLYDNIEFSTSILYLVFTLLAILASFFSGNIAFEYTERDRKDIGSLLLLGLDGRSVRKIYFRITSTVVLISLLFGLILGLLLSLLIPKLLALVEFFDFSAAGAYLTSFKVSIPVCAIASMLLLLFLVSSLTLFFTLRSLEERDLKDILLS